jgi:hypothetical protein
MFDFYIIAGSSMVIASGIFVVWFLGKLTDTSGTKQD